MQIKDYPFSKLPFSNLFQTYTSDFSKLESYFETNPFNEGDIVSHAQQLDFIGDRHRSSEILKEINERYQPNHKVFDNIDKLARKDTLAIVTGQQLGVFGGPLYTVFKILGTIHLAKRFERQLQKPVVPVFWLADEDHDYEEVQSVNIINGDDIETFSLPDKSGNLPPVAELKFPDELESLKKNVRECLYETDFSDELWDVLDHAFQAGKRFDYAFGDFVAKLFSKYGLVLAGSNHPAVKEHTKQCMKDAISNADEMREALEKQSNKLNRDYHQQVTLYDSNLFYLHEEDGRQKISRNGDGWKTDSGKEWQTQELVNEIDTDPEKFSPNVFLRPILQDYFLPTLGYVAGPGETAYYGQMKLFYQNFGLRMPVIFPRLSATFIEPAIDRILDELPFDLYEYDSRIEDLESEFVDRTEQVDIEAIFSDWKEKVESISSEKTESIKEIDPTLEGAAGKASSVYMGELDKLKGKVYRAVKQQEQTQLNRIKKIKSQLFPNGAPQERVVASIYFMNKYGISIWDELLGSLDEDEHFNSHKLISL
ncbi:bacillithiol biosynthesis cysteine-adding enzyme BshC [Balneolaceae bacterium YR4-1]|uniref:Putative cysteine ligase BshC n=1 Tax=Halalkalibaculum roseum TaxID=2709311 RepID=A0A6M1SYF0_9BACT|nr:bacillithiol biosynthesis cysteine-adding enzyme BshC [Halalkalibaculum roseum]NGP76214.1 bacillithiol biosynthesis cysteine-adding enzyme BshC [Halalkalibaculum roseum]